MHTRKRHGRWPSIRVLGLVALLAVGAAAQGGRFVAPASTPGSLLVFPLVDTTQNTLTLISITNTNTSERLIPSLPYREGDVELLLRYIYEDGSVVEDVRRLEPGGMTTFLARSHAARVYRSYLYVVARDPFTGEAIDFDFLLGTSVTVDVAAHTGFALEAIVFRALAKELNAPTGLSPLGHVYSDIAKDGVFYLDGQEFSAAYDKLSVPCLFEEVPGVIQTDVVLLTTLPPNYHVDVQMDLFNNSESLFQVPFSFRVWMRSSLGALTSMATAPNLNGANASGELRTGWARLRPRYAVNELTGKAVASPAIMGAVVTRSLTPGGRRAGGASLLIGEGARSAGFLPFLN